MDGPLANLPQASGPFGPEQALQVVRAAFETMQADGQLAEQWGEFSNLALSWSREESAIQLEALRQMRVSLEQICGDTRTGELLVAAAKIAIAACILGAGNPYVLVLGERDPIHDDTGVLTGKAVGLLYEARDTEPFDPTVRIDYDIQKALEGVAEEREADQHAAQQEEWVGDLISRAVRPGSQN